MASWIRSSEGFFGEFFFFGLCLDDLLLWTGDRGFGGGGNGQFGAGFVGFLDFLLVEGGLVGALLDSLMDLVDGAADFSGEGGELGFAGVPGAQVLDGREAVGELVD